MKTLKLRYMGTVLSKKNRHITTRQGIVIPDARARANEQDMVNQFIVQLKKQGGTRIFTMTHTDRLLEATKNAEKYVIWMKIYNETNRRRDLDNQATSILDALTKSGAIVDDCAKFVREIHVIYGGIERGNPHADIVIKITDKEDEGGAIQS